MAADTLLRSTIEEFKQLEDGYWVLTSYRGWKAEANTPTVECIFRKLKALPKTTNDFFNKSHFTDEHKIIDIIVNNLPRIRPLSVWSGKEEVIGVIGKDITAYFDFAHMKTGTIHKLVPELYEQLPEETKSLLLATQFCYVPINGYDHAKIALINCTEMFRFNWGFSTSLATFFIKASTKKGFSNVYTNYKVTEDGSAIVLRLGFRMNKSDDEFIARFADNKEAQENSLEFSSSYHSNIDKDLGLTFPRCLPFNKIKCKMSARLLYKSWGSDIVIVNRVTEIQHPPFNKEVYIIEPGQDTTGEPKKPTNFPIKDNPSEHKEDKKAKRKKNINSKKSSSNTTSTTRIQGEVNPYKTSDTKIKYIVPESEFKGEENPGVKPPPKPSDNLSSARPEKDGELPQVKHTTSKQNDQPEINPDIETHKAVSLSVFREIVNKTSNTLSGTVNTQWKSIFATTEHEYHDRENQLTRLKHFYTKKAHKLPKWYYFDPYNNIIFFDPKTNKGRKQNMDYSVQAPPPLSVHRRLALYELTNQFGFVYVYKLEPFAKPIQAFSYALVYKSDLSALTNEELNQIFYSTSKNQSLKVSYKDINIENLKHHLDKELDKCIERNANHLIDMLPKLFSTKASSSETDKTSKDNLPTKDTISDSVATS